jgi:predicted phage tail component-like protein
MSNSFTYNNIDFGGTNYGFIVEENNFVRMPTPRLNRDALAQVDGEAIQGSTFEALSGSVSGIIIATSFANLKTQRDNIMAALASGQEGAKALTFDAFAGKQWMARVVGAEPGEETSITQRLSITFVAPSPWSTATTATEGGDDNDGDGSTTL